MRKNCRSHVEVVRRERMPRLCWYRPANPSCAQLPEKGGTTGGRDANSGTETCTAQQFLHGIMVHSK